MANTPSYTIVEDSPLTSIFAGAQKAVAGIGAEVAASRKAQQAYSSFAATLEQEGLIGDAAVYRTMAESEKPNFIQAALTGQAAQRNLELPFQQALKIIDSKNDRIAAEQRARISAAEGMSVEQRQGIRMQDSILSRDVDVANQELRDARRDVQDARDAAIRDANNPELVKVHKQREQEAIVRYNEAQKRVSIYQNKRRENASRMDSAAVVGSPDPGDLPTAPYSADGEGPGNPLGLGGIVSPEPNAQLLPDISGKSIDSVTDLSSRALKRAKEAATAEYGYHPSIMKAESEKELERNVRAIKSGIANFKTSEEAMEAGKKVAPEGYQVIVTPKTDGSGYTYRLQKPSTGANKTGDNTWIRGDNIFYLGEGGVMYRRKVNQPESEGTMVTNPDGSGMTPTQLKSSFEALGEAAAIGAPTGPLPKAVNPSVKRQYQLPSYLRAPDHSNPNTPRATETPTQRTMRDWRTFKSTNPP